MEFEELNNKIKESIAYVESKKGIKYNSTSMLMHLIEELGEVVHELNRPNIRNEELNKEHLSEELADLLTLTIGLAQQHNINLETPVLKKIEELKIRYK